MNSEALKRRNIADKVIRDSNAESLTDSIFIAGSVAYGPKTSVTKKSDVDLVMIAKNPNNIISNFISDKIYQDIVEHRLFDGLTLKYDKEEVDVSIHILSKDALKVIENTVVGDIRLLRKGGKQGANGKPPIYNLNSFGEVPPYEYKIHNTPIPEALGFYRTIVPISFLDKKTDRMHMGIHRDKLMSNPTILKDSNGLLENVIDNVWKKVTKNLYDDSMRHLGKIDLTRFNIPNTLNKYAKFDSDVKDKIHKNQNYYLAKLLR